MKRFVLAVCSLFLFSGSIFSQTAASGKTATASGITSAVMGAGGAGDASLNSSKDSSTGAFAASNQALLSMATADYPVTPGDIYILSYLKSYVPDTLQVVVEGDGAVNMSFFGKYQTSGMTFRAFKTLIEKKVADSYPGSTPSLLIRSTGVFPVWIKGEVTQADQVQAGGLTKLSEVITPFKTNFSSMREVSVLSTAGKTNVYDLFKAMRYGDRGQDPYVRSGDTIILKKLDRLVTVMGEVKRPGSYQLLGKEGIAELINVYADGLLDTARPDRSLLIRRVTEGKPVGESRVIDLNAGSADLSSVSILDGDAVRVSSRYEYLPAIYLEGAVGGGVKNTITVMNPSKSSSIPSDLVTEPYTIIRQSYKKGALVSELLKEHKLAISATADLRNAYIIRKGMNQPLPIDAEKLLYSFDSRYDQLLEPEDRIIIPNGSLSVFVTGEVTKSTWVDISSMMRLSGVIAPLLTKFSSLRNVAVRNEAGEETVYDLFRADRFGDLSQDPLVRPGQQIILKPFQRVVTISGEVRKPGIYQLLPEDGIKELFEVYAGGFTEKADKNRINLVRFISSSSEVGEKIRFDYEKTPGLVLNLYDYLTIPPLQDLLPVVWFEGAVGVGVNGVAPEAAQRIEHTFFPGETLSQASQIVRSKFSEVSDIEHAYILRDGKKIPANIADLIYRKTDSGDIVLKPNDTIIIPFRQFFVTVSDSVNTPGRYPYVPDRKWDYYVGLAGGFDTDKNVGQKTTIRDINGKVQDHARAIQPEDNIQAETNSFVYWLFRISTIITSIFSVASLILTLTKL